MEQAEQHKKMCAFFCTEPSKEMSRVKIMSYKNASKMNQPGKESSKNCSGSILNARQFTEWRKKMTYWRKPQEANFFSFLFVPLFSSIYTYNFDPPSECRTSGLCNWSPLLLPRVQKTQEWEHIVWTWRRQQYQQNIALKNRFSCYFPSLSLQCVRLLGCQCCYSE